MYKFLNYPHFQCKSIYFCSFDVSLLSRYATGQIPRKPLIYMDILHTYYTSSVTAFVCIVCIQCAAVSTLSYHCLYSSYFLMLRYIFLFVYSVHLSYTDFTNTRSEYIQVASKVILIHFISCQTTPLKVLLLEQVLRSE